MIERCLLLCPYANSVTGQRREGELRNDLICCVRNEILKNWQKPRSPSGQPPGGTVSWGHRQGAGPCRTIFGKLADEPEERFIWQR